MHTAFFVYFVSLRATIFPCTNQSVQQTHIPFSVSGIFVFHPDLFFYRSAT